MKSDRVQGFLFFALLIPMLIGAFWALAVHPQWVRDFIALIGIGAVAAPIVLLVFAAVLEVLGGGLPLLAGGKKK